MSSKFEWRFHLEGYIIAVTDCELEYPQELIDYNKNENYSSLDWLACCLGAAIPRNIPDPYHN